MIHARHAVTGRRVSGRSGLTHGGMSGVTGQKPHGNELQVGEPDSGTLQRLREKLGLPAKKDRDEHAN